MKKATALFLFLLLASSLSAKSVRQMWTSMPDSLTPYLNKSLRIELIDFYDMKVKAEVKNQLEDSTSVDTLTADYIHVKLSKSSEMELKMLPFTGGDSILCLVSTYYGDAAESTVSFFDQNWKSLNLNSTFDGQSIASLKNGLTHKPDSISQDKYQTMLLALDPMLVKASLSPNTDEITFSLSTPLMTKEEKEQIRPILLSKKLKWNGSLFKEI